MFARMRQLVENLLSRDVAPTEPASSTFGAGHEHSAEAKKRADEFEFARQKEQGIRRN